MIQPTSETLGRTKNESTTKMNATAIPAQIDAATADYEAEVAEEPATRKAAASEQATDTEDSTADCDATTAEDDTPANTPAKAKRRTRVLAFGVLPGVALLLALTAGFLKWQDSSSRDSDIAAVESVQTARDSTIALLSYRPGTVDKQLTAARDLLTGPFRDSYTSLTRDVVIPGAKQKQISAAASVAAVASVSANPSHAVALVFVNQTVVVGNDAPTDTASSVKVTMEKTGSRWLISGFDPI
ncbi:MAG: rane protein [Mycobacterium sp.]|nr:rane protein [Mycobacterium sp.]